MSLPDQFIAKLRFKTDEVDDKWLAFKNSCENDSLDNLQPFISEWILRSQKILNNFIFNPKFENQSIGMCGCDDSDINPYKRIVFGSSSTYDIIFRIENQLIEGQEKWSFNELDALMQSFISIMSEYHTDSYISGTIELILKN